ncbi:PH domain-containing protein [Sphingobacterium kyonggiense]
MRQFKPKRDLSQFKLAFLILIPIITLIAILSDSWQEAVLVNTIISALLISMLLIIMYTTSYKIDGEILRYRSFFLFGKVSISDIRQLEVGKTMYVGIKPATAKHGIIVRYNRYDEIYISPENNQEVVQALLEINPNIEVVDYPEK